MVGMLIVVMIGGGAGCTSPPSVMPLLEATERALAAESAYVRDDGEREAEWLAQSRRSLAHAYEADLAAVEELTADWVREATRVYVLARETLTRHEAELMAQRRRRVENLEAATEAVRRAGAMIQQQDRLWLEMGGLDVWALTGGER